MKATQSVAKILRWLYDSRWTELHELGENRLIRSSYIWFVLVPILAKLLLNLRQMESKLPVWLQGFIGLDLPFTWQFLFSAAVFFSIAHACYHVAAPTMIRRFPNAAMYRQEGYGVEQIRDAYIILAQRDIGGRHERDLMNNIVEMYTKYCDENKDIESVLNTGNIYQVLSAITIKPEYLQAAYLHLREYIDTDSPVWRGVSTLSYRLGLASILIIAIENVMIVWQVS